LEDSEDVKGADESEVGKNKEDVEKSG